MYCSINKFRLHIFQRPSIVSINQFDMRRASHMCMKLSIFFPIFRSLIECREYETDRFPAERRDAFN